MRNVTRLSTRAFTMIVLLVLSASALALTPVEIMNKNEDARKLQTLEAKAVLSTSGGERKAATKEFTWWRKLDVDGVRFKTLTKFFAPAEIKDESILFLEKSKGENEIMIYFPNLKKVRRVEAQQQSSSFMNSDFSYSDLTAVHVDEYDFKALSDEKCPQIPSKKCFVIEATPKTEDLKIKLGYTKTVSWITQDQFMVSQVEYYDLQGAKVKRLSAEETILVDQEKKKFFSHKLTMENLNKKQQTVLKFSQVKVNQSISDAKFNKQNLGKD